MIWKHNVMEAKAEKSFKEGVVSGVKHSKGVQWDKAWSHRCGNSVTFRPWLYLMLGVKSEWKARYGENVSIAFESSRIV